MNELNIYYKLNDDKTVEPCDMKTCNDQITEMRRTHTKHVKFDRINDKDVSTVWLGLNHSSETNGKPLIFETMVFDNNSKDWQDEYCERYSTYQEAEEGHKKAVEWVKNGCKHE